ncbi:MAG: porin [Vicinamibacterales bacterium]
MASKCRVPVLVLAWVLGAAPPATAQWQIQSADGQNSVSIGVLAQPQFETTRLEGADGASSFHLRRMRFILGGKVGNRISFFIDTDVPNLGKPDASGRKAGASFTIQDAVFTYTLAGKVNLEAGMIIVPVARHATQSAANLLGVDYAPFSFSHSDPTGSNCGRDYGVQARGYLFDNHLEFRAGIFDGKRGAGATMPLRYAVRAVWHALEAETGLFYAGTSLGKRRVFSLGASIDRQDDYMARAVDIYLDHPAGGGRLGLTAQMNYTRYDGGQTFTELPAQDVWMVEGGLFDSRSRLGPFLQWTSRQYRAAELSDESRVTGGLAYWAEGHRYNIKAGVGRHTTAGGKRRMLIVTQLQVFLF